MYRTDVLFRPLRPAALTLAAMICLTACRQRGSLQPERTAARDTVAELVLQVSRCSRLHTAEMQVHKLVTHSDEVRMKGRLLSSDYDVRLPLGDRKAVVPIDVTLKAYIDFAGFDSTHVSRQGRHITLTLPDPVVTVTSSKVDHYATRQFTDPMRSAYSDAELAELARQGEDSIVSHIDRYGLIEAARASAARTLIPLLTDLGYAESDVTIRFRHGLRASDLVEHRAPADGANQRLAP